MKHPKTVFVLFVLLISACSKILPKYDATFIIDPPDALQMMNISEELISSFENTIESISTGNTMAEPTALTELTCVGVLIGYTTTPRLGTCIFNTGSEIPVGQFGGLVSYNGSGASEVRVEDLIGDQQIDVYAVGFKTSDSTCAKLLPGVDPKEGTSAEYSEPYILGAISGFLAGGKNNFFPEINANFNSNYRVDDCRGPLFNKDSVLREGLVAFWDFDNFSGLNTVSTFGNFTMTASTAGMLNTTGMKSLGLSLNNINQSASVSTDTGEFALVNNLSFSFWFKGTSASTASILLGRNASTAYGYWVRSTACSLGICEIWGYLDSNANTADNNYVIKCPTPIDITNRFHHVMGTYEKTTIGKYNYSLYLDGQLCGSRTNITPATAGSSTNFKIGEGGSAFPTNYKIDSVGVWNRALRNFEVQSLYNGGSAREYPFDN